jgi:hypothetical protein
MEERMLHLVVAKHGPDTCPASVSDIRERLLPHFEKLQESAQKLGIEVKDGWADMPSHEIFILLDAPHAHAVNQLMLDVHLLDWNTITIHPVTTLPQATDTARQRAL